MKEYAMVRYVKTIDELIDIIDKDFSGSNAVCPICKRGIGTINIPNVELGLPEFHFMQYRHSGIFCTEGHCVISIEDGKKDKEKEAKASGEYKIYIQDLGIKVFEVMKTAKPYLDVDESIPNAQLYWALMDKGNRVYTRGLSYEDALDLQDRLHKLGARAKIV
jgi:hypothetical protein